jgi:hypothetical protein
MPTVSGRLGTWFDTHVAAAKGLLEPHLLDAEPRGFGRIDKGIAHEDFEVQPGQHLDEAPGDLARAQQGDRLAVAAGPGERAPGSRAPQLADLAGVPEKALAGEDDLGEGKLRDGDRVRGPGAGNPHAALQQRRRESAHAPRRVEQDLEARQQRELGRAQRRHAPRGEEGAEVGESRGLALEVGRREHARVQVGQPGDAGAPALVVDLGEAVRIGAEERGLGLFHRLKGSAPRPPVSTRPRPRAA